MGVVAYDAMSGPPHALAGLSRHADLKRAREAGEALAPRSCKQPRISLMSMLESVTLQPKPLNLSTTPPKRDRGGAKRRLFERQQHAVDVSHAPCSLRQRETCTEAAMDLTHARSPQTPTDKTGKPRFAGVESWPYLS